MSLYGAMFSGVSGLAAQSQAMGMISDNISNVNTVGFKRSSAKFSTLVTESASENAYVPGGVMSRPFQMVSRQGLLQSSVSPTDLAISGEGFFVVNSVQQPTTTSGLYSFTRAGSFLPDEDGYLRNAAGYYLQGVAIPASGVVPALPTAVGSLETVNVYALSNSWQASTAMEATANLQSTQSVNANIGNYGFGGGNVNMSAGTIDPDFETTLQIYDSQGGTRNVTLGFLKRSTANQWYVEVYVEPSSDVNAAGAPTHPNGRIAQGTISFGTDGSFSSVSLTDPDGGALGTGNQMTINWATALGLAQGQVTLDVSTFTQAASASRLISSEVDGAVLGAYAGVSIDENGIVYSLFDNGQSRAIYKLPVATFPNPDGLTNYNGNTWLEDVNSGPYSLLTAGTQGAGKVSSGALESSTVDLAEEFTNMIITQRAYSAAGKIITTADEMLDELIRLKR